MTKKKTEKTTTPTKTAPKPVTIEQHAKNAGTPKWAFEAAKTKHGWIHGQEMSRQAFDSGIRSTRSERIK